MQPLPFAEARETVLRTVGVAVAPPPIEIIPLEACSSRVLARDLTTDRDYPPLPRSIRDGYAVRSSDFPGTPRVTGEVRAGERFARTIAAGEAIEIMTGAGVPEGADAIIMVEHAKQENGLLITDKSPKPGDFIVPAGAEAPAGATFLTAGTRLNYGHVAALAATGHVTLPVFRKPQVSILATGDEIVGLDAQPAPHQIRNSNSHTLAQQIIRAGGLPIIHPVASDQYEPTRELIEQALSTSDLLLLSGGVSAGKYDLVENVLADLGAEFYFDRVLIQPGQPLVFGRVQGKFFFGLPGNPASTMVTFEIFARAAIDLMSGCSTSSLPITWAKLRTAFQHRPGLTRFLPACLHEGEVMPTKWQGSGDVFALAKANAFLIARHDRESWQPGEFIEVITR